MDISKLAVELSDGKNKSTKSIPFGESTSIIYKLDNLVSGANYTYKVFIECRGEVIWGTEQMFKTLEVPQGSITGLNYKDLTETSVSISVSYSTPDEFPLKELKLKIREIEDETKELELPIIGNVILVENLKPNTFYRINASLTNEGGTAVSEDLLIQTLTLDGQWKYLLSDTKRRFFPVYIADEKNNLYFGLGTGYGNPEQFKDWNKYDGENIISLSPYPGYIDSSRDNSGFCIGDYIYIISRSQEVWCYDINNDSWTRKKDFQNACTTQCCFSYNGKGYYGFGLWARNTLFEYDPETDTWTDLPNCPMRIDRGIFFLIDGYIYAGGEYAQKKMYRYSIKDRKWDMVADFPGRAYKDFQCFSIGNKGYVTGGIPDGEYSAIYEVWEYNSFNDTWTRKADLPAPKTWGVGCSYGKYGIVADGGTNVNSCQSGVYIFDPN